MPLQILDYSHVSPLTPQHSAITNALPNFLKGYEAKGIPAKLAEEQKKLELANAMSQMENQYYGPKTEAQINLLKAQADHQRRAAQEVSKLQGHARNVADLEKFLNDPSVSEESKKLAKALFQADIDKSNSLVGTRNQNIQFKHWSSLNKDDQAKEAGKYTSLGIGSRDAIELFNAGVTPELLHAYKQAHPEASMHEAVAAVVGQVQGGHGYGMPNQQAPQQPPVQSVEAQPQVAPETLQPEQPQNNAPLLPVDTRTVPVQPSMTGSNRTDFNNVKGALAEENYIHPIITDAMKPYAKKYAGYSPKQFWDTFKGDKDAVDKMAKFYAARALQPEIAGIRSRMAGGSNAAQALHDIQVQALNQIDVMDWRVSPEAYAKAQDYISQWMTGMTNARLNAMSGQIANPGFKEVLVETAGQQEAKGKSNKKLFGKLQLEDDGSL